eukprot:TRINITY_DN22461_c0_g1_i1.p1 TRINITY_DN22461_c0_g1~~TRINITY_DN22461_c0_g1_i1.p1  ORF type:complete len:253 (+),score=76.78 TRINITY_DN22461_c0_g1_i1:49-807(+)
MRYCRLIRRCVAAVAGAGACGLAGIRAMPDPHGDGGGAAAPHHACNADTAFDVEEIRRELEARQQGASAAGAFGTAWLLGELSSDHAGETGAVWIYEGALDAMKVNARSAAAARSFALEHRRAEQRHLDLVEAAVPAEGRTRLLPMWRLSGWLLGVVPTLLGPEALFATVEAVETFVEEHYMQQIAPLEADGSCPELTRMLRACCEDEVHHREDAAEKARAAGAAPAGLLTRGWQAVVEGGSAAAAEVARRV